MAAVLSSGAVPPSRQATFREVPRHNAAPIRPVRTHIRPRSAVLRTFHHRLLFSAPSDVAASLLGLPGTSDQDVKAGTPSKRRAGLSTSATGSSGGFFDTRIPPPPEDPADKKPAAQPAAQPADTEATAKKPAGRLQQLLQPLSDPVANRRLLALCFAQTLCSVATLIHDTYLPVYLQDVLGMSNQKVSMPVVVDALELQMYFSWTSDVSESITRIRAASHLC